MVIYGGGKMINKYSDIYRLCIARYTLQHIGGSLLSIILLLFLTSCSTAPAKKSEPIKQLEQREIMTSTNPEVTSNNPERPTLNLEKPDFITLAEELSPLKTKVVSISARNTPLRDALHVIADATKLNLVMEKGVDPETPITITLNNVSAEDALDTIFTSVDYFYSIKGNMLYVKAMDTRMFEFGQPSVLQEYIVDVGGDILGGIMAGTLTTTGGAGTSNIKGGVTQKIKSDASSFEKFWDSIETTIKNLIAPGGKLQKTTEGPPQIQPTFSINRLTGTIAVTATKNDLEKVERYLTALKNVLKRQVLIEARIVEVQLTEAMKYGIDWTIVDNWLGVGTISLGTTTFSDVVGTTEPRLQFSITGTNFTSLLQALEQQGEVRTLSNPRINIMNGQTALLSVGRSSSFISRVETVTSTTGAIATTTYTVDTSSILSGIIIGIVPYIDEKGEITLTIAPIVSDLYKLEEKSVGTTAISLPTVDLRELSTTIKLKDNMMVVIGGLITKEDKLDEYEVPVLAKIPLLGRLFKRYSKTKENAELVIMLRPTLVTN